MMRAASGTLSPTPNAILSDSFKPLVLAVVTDIVAVGEVVCDPISGVVELVMMLIPLVVLLAVEVVLERVVTAGPVFEVVVGGFVLEYVAGISVKICWPVGGVKSVPPTVDKVPSLKKDTVISGFGPPCWISKRNPAPTSSLFESTA